MTRRGGRLIARAHGRVDAIRLGRRYCTVVFMHLDEWDRYGYVLEAARVLRPGGRLYIDNFTLTTDEGWRVFEEVRLAFPRRKPSHVSKASTPQELEAYLGRAGFEAASVEVDGAWVRAVGRLPAEHGLVQA